LTDEGLNRIEKIFLNSIQLKELIVKEKIYRSIARMGEIAGDSITNGGKIMLCGNGGSAADAQHLAAEMLVRLRPMNNREGIAAIALAQDTSTITACGNDFGYEVLYDRVLRSLGKTGDCFIGITTSGNSKNVILAMKAAQELGIKVFGFLGCGGGKAIEYCDEFFLVPSDNTGRIQEAHITAGHALMEYIEDKLLENGHIRLNNNL
jgi:D-sedoheptulose 7-phosphate isomerase